MKKSGFLTAGIILVAAIICALAFVSIGQAQADTTRYVREGATGNGTSWSNASENLQGMIDTVEAAGGGEVWVASGTYQPMGGTGGREASFRLRNNVSVYGGFPDTGNPQWEDRDWRVYETVLSGDIGVLGVDTDNSYQVIYTSDVNNSAILDGFTVRDGYANGVSYRCHGGGIYNDGGDPLLRYCTFSHNWADSGGGMFNNGGSPTLIFCTFAANTANYDGGGMFNMSSDPMVTNSVFLGNKTELRDGGAMTNDQAAPVMTNCTLYGNVADRFGGGICNINQGDPLLINCILWANSGNQIYTEDGDPDVTYSCVQGGFYGAGNIYWDPLFVDPGAGDLHLQGSSPCINIGHEGAPELPAFDYDGDNRVICGGVDMGADEYVIEYTLATASDPNGAVMTPAEGTYSYQCETVVPLVAEASPCYEFVEWTGDTNTIADVDSASTEITMLADYSIVANFALRTVDLTATSNEGGGVTDPSQGTTRYDCGTVVPIIAVASPCYEFAGWSGDTATIANPTAPNTTIMMNDDYAIQAEFAVKTLELTTTSTSGGAVTIPGEDTNEYDCGTPVSIHAEADPNCRFTGWTGDTANIVNPGSPVTEILMAADYAIEAHFCHMHGPVTAERTIPSVAQPGSPFDVQIDVSDCGEMGQVIETIPEGFTYMGTTAPGYVDIEGRTIKFTFIGNEAHFFYTLQSPGTETVYPWSGFVKDADQIAYCMGGDNSVEVLFWSPWLYDVDHDNDISKQEALVAVVDYFDGGLSKEQALEVIVLYFN